MIIIGINSGAEATAYFQGHAKNPRLPRGDMHYMALSIILIIVFVVVLFVYILTGRKNDKGLTGLQVLKSKRGARKPTKAEE